MQNPATLTKWSDIKGLAAVTIEDGKKVGTIEDFYFDPTAGTVLAFAIKTGLFGQRVLMTPSITALGTDALTFANEDALLKESHTSIPTGTILGQSMLTYRVLSVGGTVLGTLGNIMLDVMLPSVRINSFELGGGLREHISGNYPTFPANQVVNYGQDVIIIPDTLGLTLVK